MVQRKVLRAWKNWANLLGNGCLGGCLTLVIKAKEFSQGSSITFHEADLEIMVVLLRLEAICGEKPHQWEPGFNLDICVFSKLFWTF